MQDENPALRDGGSGKRGRRRDRVAPGSDVDFGTMKARDNLYDMFAGVDP
jgi:hypothetical protein